MRPMVRVAGALAYRVAIEFATALGALRITDARLREQARKSTIGCVLNIAEGAGRRSRADKSRVYAIALGEGTRATGSSSSRFSINARDVLICAKHPDLSYASPRRSS